MTAEVVLEPDQFAIVAGSRVRISAPAGRRPPLVVVRELGTGRYLVARTRARHESLTPIVRRSTPLENIYMFWLLDVPHLTWHELPPPEEPRN